MRRPLLSDLEQVDPSLLTQEAVGHKNPEETSGRNMAWTQVALAVAAPALGGNYIALVGRGIAAGTDTTVLCHRWSG